MNTPQSFSRAKVLLTLLTTLILLIPYLRAILKGISKSIVSPASITQPIKRTPRPIPHTIADRNTGLEVLELITNLTLTDGTIIPPLPNAAAEALSGPQQPKRKEAMQTEIHWNHHSL